MDRARFGSCLLCLVTTALLSPRVGQGEPVAPADEARQQAAARALVDEGFAAYGVKDYDRAIERFRAAYEIWPAPSLVYNIAQAFRLAGRCADALRSYREFLERDPDVENRTAVELRIVEMERCTE